LFSSASIPDPFVARLLDGRYEIAERLGEGGAGLVYRAKDTKLGRLVAIKVLHQHTADQPEWRRRFEREAKVLSALAHPNIVAVTDSGIDDGLPYLVMELLQGKTLADVITEGSLPSSRALDIARQLLRGLAFAHAKGIVHRDLKPANVFLQALPDQADHVKLLDFGMAKFLEASASRSVVDNLTQEGTVFGTPSYMSPEQGKAEPLDERTDVYAAGVILFELLIGRTPFAGDKFQEIARAHLLDPIPSLAAARPDLSIAAFLQPVIDRAMAKKSVERYPDAASMLAALEAINAVSRVVAASAGLADAPKKPSARMERVRTVMAHSWRAVVAMTTLAAAMTSVFTYLGRDSARRIGGIAPAAAQTPMPNVASSTRRVPARDPWQEGVPAALESIRGRIDHGERMSESSLRPVYLFARQHPEDARPWLLVGRAYAELDWLSDSVERYLRAYRIDQGCRGDSQMLADLIKAAEHPVAGRAAAKAIADVYGAEAIPAVEKALERQVRDRDANARLTRLREALRR
jgi:tRNA A-37 threonylcarbamoyl transferase component Bud32